ncbi:hypothetical protein DesfrDRAFT_0448 [Solidesulfovibrio fructosivorans JJ]]|uniref:Uncharacterized protein n=1 Tax=Solidesulfovibrio fructosivorans JJ] TaxID=596151 RepID=E1JS49_SOLFR|nr:hypothetical protein DesfrDRAFT_0448 [Solidesulfovibrio fructosivorans JJ]]
MLTPLPEIPEAPDAGATERPVPPLLPRPLQDLSDAEPSSAGPAPKQSSRHNPFAGVRVRLVLPGRRHVLS